MSKKDYDKKIIELRDYLESFVKRYQNQSLHLIDITRHLNIISSYEEELEIIAERINNAKTCVLKDKGDEK